MIQDIINKISKTSIVTLNEKNLKKINEMTRNNFSSPNEALNYVITHAYMLYKNNAFKIPNLNGNSDPYIKAYSDLSPLEKELLTSELVRLSKLNVTTDEMSSKFSISKTAINKLLKSTYNKGYEQLTSKEKANAKEVILQQYIPGHKTKAEIIETLKIGSNAFDILSQELLNSFVTEKTKQTASANKGYPNLTDEEKNHARNIILQEYVHGNKTKAEIIKILKIGNKTFNILHNQVCPVINKGYADLTAEQKKQIKKNILNNSSSKSDLCKQFGISSNAYKKLRNETLEESNNLNKQHQEAKISEIILYKRLEIFSDEEIMKKLNLNKTEYNTLLESIYT